MTEEDVHASDEAALASDATGSLTTEEDVHARQRRVMVDIIRRRGVRHERVLNAMGAVRRHRYIPEEYRSHRAYGDHPLPIGHGQTISQPYIVAYMTEAMEVEEGEKVLEIGTGSGYQAAVLAEMGARVFSVEIIPELARHASDVLRGEGYGNVAVRAGDGYQGWPEKAPFDAIVVTCAPEDIPPALVEQLKEGGRIIIPVGGRRGIQKMVYGEKQGGRLVTRNVLDVRFVPMVKGGE